MNEGVAPTQDERVLAALAHGSILLGLVSNGFGGIVAALIIWLLQREKSAYVAFQALQAMVYQLLGLVVAIAAWGCWMFTFFASIFIPLLARPGAYEEAPPVSMFIGLALMLVPLGLMGLWALYGLWGALRTYQGADFKYLIIGRMLER
ncbi:MAG: DUF4870 domain-containing protein [Anaerolineae bacterium]